MKLIFKVGQNPPEVGRDPHWEVGIPEELPYTVASLPFRINNMEETTYAAEKLIVPIDQQRVLAPEDMESRYGDDKASVLDFSTVVNATQAVMLSKQ